MNSRSLRDLLCAGPRIETLNAIDDGRASSELLPLLDGELERIRSRLQLLQAYRDDLVLINKLPVEVLVHIFLVYAEDSDQLFDLRWTKLMSVCKRWRDIGEQTPKLWSFIQVAPVVTRSETREVRRIHAQILRASTSDLRIRMRLDHSLPMAMKYLPMFTARSNALRCLDLVGDPRQIVKVVDALIRAQITAVVDLTIRLQLRKGWLDQQWVDQQAASSEISTLVFEKALSETLPQLRHLSISGMCINWARATTYDLRTLDIDLSNADPTASSSFAFSDITDALSRCPHIAHLSLSFHPTFNPLIETNLADLNIAVSFPHALSIFIEGTSKLCAGILCSLKEIPPIAQIAVSAPDPIETHDLEPVEALTSYMTRHALKVGAPPIRALALSTIPLRPPRRERPYELRIAGQLHSDREPAAWSKASPPGALVAICLRFKMGPFHALRVMEHTFESWPLEQATVIDVHQHMIGITGVGFWQAVFPHLPAIRTAIVPFGPCGIEMTLIEHLRAVPQLRERGHGAVTQIIFDGDWDGFNADDARLRVTLMRALQYCADAARAGTPLDTVEVTHGYGSETSPAGTSVSGRDMFNHDCDWNELYRDLRQGFIYQGVLHNATV